MQLVDLDPLGAVKVSGNINYLLRADLGLSMSLNLVSNKISRVFLSILMIFLLRPSHFGQLAVQPDHLCQR